MSKHAEKLTRKKYEKELHELQGQLCKLQEVRHLKDTPLVLVGRICPGLLSGQSRKCFLTRLH
jgi:hypothetical protein